MALAGLELTEIPALAFQLPGLKVFTTMPGTKSILEQNRICRLYLVQYFCMCVGGWTCNGSVEIRGQLSEN